MNREPQTTDGARAVEVNPLTAKYRPLRGGWRWVAIVIPVIVILMAVNFTFDLRFFIGYMMYDTSYYYLILALILPLAFLHVPARPRMKGVWARRLFWVDVIFFFLILGIGIFFAWHGYDITLKGWARVAPSLAVIMSMILWFLLVEAIRRTTGMILGVIVLIGSFYPLFAQYMPGVLEGISLPFSLTAQFHMLSNDSAMGLLMKLYVSIIVGFTLFGVAVLATGGGQFFINLALPLVGRTRGGMAKVSVISSAMFGSLSGSSIVNVITTGSVTIPAMKKAGYPPHYAGAIEACASTAGTFTPPIMGATAFVMASFLNLPYVYVALAAAIPALLFYFALYLQIDGFAAKVRLQGRAKSEAPPFVKTLKDGWFYLPAMAILLYYLLVLRSVGESAYVATAVMLVLAQARKETRFTWQSFLGFLEDSGRVLMELFVVIAGVGMLMGSFAITGLAVTFARELLIAAGGNLAFMLILCAVASIIMGMGMPLIAVYVFLSITIAPALVLKGLSELAVHLFVLYYGMLSFITPPVALCAFPAAVIAGSTPMKVAVTAVRLGAVLFLLPFFFVLDPALILQGGIGEILLALSTTALGVFLIGSASEGYMMGIGKLWPAKKGGFSLAGYSLNSYFLRAALIISGILLGLPWGQTKGLGVVIAAVILLPMFFVAYCRRSGGIFNGNQ